MIIYGSRPRQTEPGNYIPSMQSTMQNPTREEQMLHSTRKFTDYLIEMCCRHELGVAQFTDIGLNMIVQHIIGNWHLIEHQHKKLVDIEKLKVSPSGAYINFPTMIRHCACKVAMNIPDGPLFKQPYCYIHQYVADMMGKQTNQEYICE